MGRGIYYICIIPNNYILIICNKIIGFKTRFKFIQVGDGDTDHYCWQRPEDMTTSRQAYKIDENNPGSDLAGETAAAMAAASIVFKKTNPHYSHLLLHHAQQVHLKRFLSFIQKRKKKRFLVINRSSGVVL